MTGCRPVLHKHESLNASRELLACAVSVWMED